MLSGLFGTDNVHRFALNGPFHFKISTQVSTKNYVKKAKKLLIDKAIFVTFTALTFSSSDKFSQSAINQRIGQVSGHFH